MTKRAHETIGIILNPLTDPGAFDWVCLCRGCSRVVTFTYKGAAPGEQFPACDLCGFRTDRDDIVSNGHYRAKSAAKVAGSN